MNTHDFVNEYLQVFRIDDVNKPLFRRSLQGQRCWERQQLGCVHKCMDTNHFLDP